jgi:CBS domain-containing protein
MEQKRVRDLMLSLEEYATIGADKTIREALEALSKSQLGLTQDRHQHRAVLVLDQEKKVLGKLSHWAILRALEPKFLKTDDVASLSRAGLTEEFIKTMEQGFNMFTGSLEQMCRYAARLKAKDAMVPVGESIDENASLTDAIRMLTMKHVQSLPVTRGDQVVGILRLSDVFQEVAEIITRSDAV